MVSNDPLAVAVYGSRPSKQLYSVVVAVWLRGSEILSLGMLLLALYLGCGLAVAVVVVVVVLNLFALVEWRPMVPVLCHAVKSSRHI